MKSVQLDVNKMNRCKKSLLEDYFQASIVEEAVDAIDYVEENHRDLEFLKFGRWIYIPKEWFTDPSVYPDIAFGDIGRGIAFGEKRHIVQQILTSPKVNRVSVEKVTYKTLREIIQQLISSKERDSNLVMFSPIEYFVTMHVNWAREEGRILVQDESLLVRNSRLKIFWSNKYVDFKEFIVAKRSSCRFVVKPKVKDRLQIELYESQIESENMELKAQTVFNFTILDPQEIRVVRPTLPVKGPQ